MEKVIGQESGQVIFAIMEGNTIKRLYSNYIEYPDNTYDGNTYLTDSSSGGSYEVNGVTYKAGMELAEDFEPFFDDEEIKETILNEQYYTSYGSWCEECGKFHDTEQYYNLSYIITEDGAFLCKTCASVEDMLIEVESGDDIFKSKDITGMEFASDEFEEVDTLFCDSSGFGRDNEPALTEKQAKQAVEKLLNKHRTLYSGLTGIGQFQVYVTLYKRKAVSKTA